MILCGGQPWKDTIAKVGSRHPPRRCGEQRKVVDVETGAIAAGQLLIATEPGRGGYFDQSVVLVVEHNETGSLGVCLHRPTEVPIHALLPAFAAHADPSIAYEGGPVNPEAVIIMGEPATPEAPPPGWQRIRGEVGVIEPSFPEELIGSSFGQLRVFVGLSGWAPGQLESELIRGSWFRGLVQPSDVFGDSTSLWRRVLRRMGGTTGRWSAWTERPELN